jgi:hypothetical protein
MKSLMMIAMAVTTIFIIQVTNSVAELSLNLADNEIMILSSTVKHGTEFGKEWTKEQQKVWEKTQRWFQVRMSDDWRNLENFYHKDAIFYHYFHKLPLNFSAYEKLMSGKMFWQAYCTVHEIKIIENIAILMMYYQVDSGSSPKRMTFVWMKQGTDWKLVTSMNKEE